MTERKKRESITGKARLKIRKRYEKSFLMTAVLLCLYQIKYYILSGAANLVFSGRKQKTTKLLMFANRSVNKNICKCQMIAEKCEYYKKRIDMLNVG